MMKSHGPTAAESPLATKHDADHAGWANGVRKLVFSTTLQAANWDGSRIVRDVDVVALRRMQSEPGKNLLLLGSPSPAQSFVRLGLIDAFRLNVDPVALGSGVALFEELGEPPNPELTATKVFVSGVVGLTDQRAQGSRRSGTSR